MQKFVTAIFALAVALCVTAWGLWIVPPADPVDYIQFNLGHHANATVGVTAAEAAEVCPPEMAYYRVPCIDHLSRPHFAAWESRTRFLSEVQAIPDEDCARMTEVLIARSHLTNDGTLVKNARSGFNCDFARHGLAHVEWPDRPGNYACQPDYDVDRTTAMSTADFDVCVRKTYVTRPVYNLSRTRFSIISGDGRNGAKCLYTRIENWHLTGQWRLERCTESWSF